MVERLKSTARQIHWSLLLKAAVFAVLWSIAPLWVAIVFALFVYAIPWFKPLSLWLPFLLLILLALFLPHNFFAVLSLGVLFYLVVGIKDLLFVNRLQAYEILALLLSFISFLYTFTRISEMSTGSRYFALLIPATIAFLLLRGLENYLGEGIERRVGFRGKMFCAAFLLSQLSFALLFMPVGVLVQTAIMFIAVSIVVEIAVDECLGQLHSQRLLFYFLLFFVVSTLILVSVEWGL